MEEKSLLKELLVFLRLTHEKEDPAVIQEVIEKGVVFRGTNLWILIFAILVASVGLNMNSTAVIIGAMLISPLMGPIQGIGFSVATYNFPLFRKSLVNFGFATGVALLTSTMYFVLTPIHAEHSELLARTSPTIYDVLIAFFGGLAGIVAVSSKNKGNVLPGVAIATALMPPLCTAGYGISIGNWSYFLGASYLFLINSVFIALSAMLVSQLLKLPRQAYLLSREIKNKNIAVIAVIAITVLPSIYLGYTLVRKEKFEERVSGFVKDVGNWEGNYLLSHELSRDGSELHLVYAGSEFDKATLKRLTQKARDLGLDDVKLVVEQGIRVESVGNVTSSNDHSGELERLRSAVSYREMELDSLRNIPKIGDRLLEELSILYPSIYACSYAETIRFVDSLDREQNVSLVLLSSQESIEKEDRVKIHTWLKKRLNSKYVELRF